MSDLWFDGNRQDLLIDTIVEKVIVRCDAMTFVATLILFSSSVSIMVHLPHTHHWGLYIMGIWRVNLIYWIMLK